MECANTGLKTVCLTGSDASAVRLWGLRMVKDGGAVGNWCPQQDDASMGSHHRPVP